MSNSMRDFFWFCSGASFSILKKCPTEHSKFVGIGATVFFTGLFASISSGYALYFVFNDVETTLRLILAVVFGLFWGFMIFNLDRYIVSSMKKQNSFWNEFKMVSPRVIFAILIAFVMSKPLELQVFHTSIEYKLADLEQLEQKKIEASKEERYTKQLNDLIKEIQVLQNAIDFKESSYNNLQASANCEWDGTCGSNTKGDGPIYREKKYTAEKANKEYEAEKIKNQPQIDAKNLKLEDIRDKLEIEKRKVKYGSYDGFDKRLTALGVVSAENKSIYFASLFLMLLLIALELSPIFVKLFSPKGPYDELLELKEHIHEVYKIEKMSKLNQATNERLKIVLESSDNKVREELDGNKNLMKSIIEAEQVLAQEMINQWKESELSKIRKK